MKCTKITIAGSTNNHATNIGIDINHVEELMETSCVIKCDPVQQKGHLVVQVLF